MLPPEFYFGNATTLLLWLFQSVPHEVLLGLILTSVVLAVVVGLCIVIVMIYVAISCFLRITRLTALLAAHLYYRLRIRPVRGEVLLAAPRQGDRARPLALRRELVAEFPPGEDNTLRTPPALRQPPAAPALPAPTTPALQDDTSHQLPAPPPDESYAPVAATRRRSSRLMENLTD